MSELSVIKKFILYFLLLSVIACSESSVEKEEPIIAVSIPPLADFASQIGGNRITVKTLIQPGDNMHSFDPSPETIKTIYKSDIFFSLGKYSNFETQLLKKIGNENINKLIDLSNSVSLIDKDPHYWLSPENAKIIVNIMLDEFIEILPQHKPYFINNCKRFIKKLDSLDKEISEVLHLKRNKILFVYHPAWGYFTDYYGIDQYSIEHEGKSPKAGDLKEILSSAKEKGVQCIFFDPHFDNSSVSAIAEELKISIDSLDPLPIDYLSNLADIANKLERYLR